MISEEGWCSWCNTKTNHLEEKKGLIERNAYRCSQCGFRTLHCRIPNCSNFAKGTPRWDHDWCSEHNGNIASFERLEQRIPAIENWREVLKREKRNVKQIGKVGGGIIVLGVATGGLAYFTAPGIGGALGWAKSLKSGKPLYGIAASNKGLAWLGGGTLAAGGHGVAGGTSLITLGGTALGGRGGGVLLNKYASDVKDFDIHCKRSGQGTRVITINGFLTQKTKNFNKWRPVLNRYWGSNTWYDVSWESQTLYKLGSLGRAIGPSPALASSLRKAAEWASKQAASRMTPFGFLDILLAGAGNPWWVALHKAEKTGRMIADLIQRADGRARYTLMGHSLGARVIYYALDALAESGTKPRINDVHLLGGAVESNAAAWERVLPAIRGSIWNYCSDNDDTLRYLYKIGTLMQSSPIGLSPIESTSDRIQDVDVTQLVKSHRDYLRLFPDYIKIEKFA